MMSEASFASLGPTLLARKGGAKPAMRPQLTPLPEDLSALAALADEQLEDLGWNDMGADREFDRISERGVDRGTGRDAPLLSIKPGAKSALRAVEETGSLGADPGCEAGDKTADSPVALEDTADIVGIGPHARAARAPLQPAAAPTVHDQRKRLEDRFAAEAARSGATLRSGPTQARRAAFTLRLDAERHLKLRLASTMHGVSAQSLVTEALDALLAEIDGLDTLVERMKRD